MQYKPGAPLDAIEGHKRRIEENRAGLIEDIESRLAEGESPASILASYKIKVQSLRRRLNRANRPDLAEVFKKGNI